MFFDNKRNHSNPSAVVNHHELGNSIDFANSCVIYPESHMTKRKIAESLWCTEEISPAKYHQHNIARNNIARNSIAGNNIARNNIAIQ